MLRVNVGVRGVRGTLWKDQPDSAGGRRAQGAVRSKSRRGSGQARGSASVHPEVTMITVIIMMTATIR